MTDKDIIAHINRPRFNLSNKEKNNAIAIKSIVIGRILKNNKIQSNTDSTTLFSAKVNVYEIKNWINVRKKQTITLDNKIDLYETGLFKMKTLLPKPYFFIFWYM